MTKFVDFGETIHADHTNVQSRKILKKGPREHPDTKERMMLYECDRNSYTEIVKECCEADKNKLYAKGYHDCLGDCLDAYAINVYVRSRTMLRTEVKEGVTARHGAQFIYPRDYAISTIRTPLQNLEKCLQTRKQQLLEKN
ncbi:MAG: hypothetical protein E7100_02920 [Bacteroidaceae bacterium]|jgi:hypothetical protein|nr:hypothetical protein [Bacteroidaceae bacterium]